MSQRRVPDSIQPVGNPRAKGIYQKARFVRIDEIGDDTKNESTDYKSPEYRELVWNPLSTQNHAEQHHRHQVVDQEEQVEMVVEEKVEVMMVAL